MQTDEQFDGTGLTVCICTFRRPSILSAIESVSKQRDLADLPIKILVVDNDAEPSALATTVEARKSSRYEVVYRHVPGQNISIARNAALDGTRTRWLVFVDDDEYAAPDWLANLYAQRIGANAVFGPCQARYSEKVARWIKEGDYHSNRIADDEIITGYTSNVLIDIAFVRRHELRFDPKLGRTGGEDTLFFFTMRQNGGVLRYSPEAIVFEDVVQSRLNARWVLRRRYRAGQVRGLMYDELDRTRYYWLSFSASGKVIICLIMAILRIVNVTSSMKWLTRGIFHLGTLSYFVGVPIYEEYKS
jgi:succinoglycan biosynthesis protein ExoM